MSGPPHVQMLVRYAAWANSLLYQRVAELPDIELIRSRQIVFGSMLRTLNHVLVMDLVWQAHLQGRPHGFTTRNPEAHPNFAALRVAQTEMDDWLIGYADGLTASSSDEIVNFDFIGGGQGSMSRSDILLHVVNHTTYHRGHIAHMIYQIPAQPPTTDLPVFLRGARNPR